MRAPNRIFLYPINLKCCRPLNLLPGHISLFITLCFYPKLKSFLHGNPRKNKKFNKTQTTHIFSVQNLCLNWSE